MVLLGDTDRALNSLVYGRLCEFWFIYLVMSIFPEALKIYHDIFEKSLSEIGCEFCHFVHCFWVIGIHMNNWEIKSFH